MCVVSLRQDGPAYVDTLLTVLRNVTKEETVQYVLALLDDIVTGGAAG
jgi:V-type H+-transporting ATPase subunit H